MANLFLGPKQSQRVPPKKEIVLMNHESCFQRVKGSWLREDACSFPYRMPKLITLSEAMWSAVPWDHSEAERSVGPQPVVCGLCWECLQFGSAQRPD